MVARCQQDRKANGARKCLPPPTPPRSAPAGRSVQTPRRYWRPCADSSRGHFAREAQVDASQLPRPRERGREGVPGSAIGLKLPERSFRPVPGSLPSPWRRPRSPSGPSASFPRKRRVTPPPPTPVQTPGSHRVPQREPRLQRPRRHGEPVQPCSAHRPGAAAAPPRHPRSPRNRPAPSAAPTVGVSGGEEGESRA